MGEYREKCIGVAITKMKQQVKETEKSWKMMIESETRLN